MNLIRHVMKSGQNAINGIIETFKNEKMIRFHFSLYLLVMFLMVILSMNTTVKFVLIIFFALTMCAELLNTAIEDVVDLVVDNNHHFLAKRAKDAAGGAVFLCAIVGYAIFLCNAYLIIIT